jgi:DNA repair protein RadC
LIDIDSVRSGNPGANRDFLGGTFVVTLRTMASIVQIRTFAPREGLAVPTMLRLGQEAPAPGIVGLSGGEAPLARVRAILIACGLSGEEIPRGLDLRPARREAWPGLDLPLAVALLAAQGALPPAAAEGAVFAGTLGAAGEIGPVDLIEAIAAQSAARGLPLICAAGQAEAAAEAGGDVYAVAGISDVLAHLSGRTPLVPVGTSWGAPSLARSGELAERASAAAVPSSPVSSPADPAPMPPGEDGSDPAGGSRNDPPFASTGPHGHRGRMRDRVLERGTASLADYELLEMLLFLANPRGDTKPLAKRLINHFGTFGAAVSASGEALLALEGVGKHVATTLLTVREAAERLGRAELMTRPLLNNWDRLIAYLNTVLAHEPIEHFRVLFLDTRNRLLADEQQAKGTVNHTPVYPREVVRRALELHATALILVHNHPSGDPTPSRDDIEMTREVKGATTALGIALHDHIIIGPGGWRSLRQMALID